MSKIEAMQEALKRLKADTKPCRQCTNIRIGDYGDAYHSEPCKQMCIAINEMWDEICDRAISNLERDIRTEATNMIAKATEILNKA